MLMRIIRRQTDFDHLIQPVSVKQLDHALVASCRNLVIDRNLRDRLDIVFCSNFFDMTVTEDLVSSRRSPDRYNKKDSLRCR